MSCDATYMVISSYSVSALKTKSVQFRIVLGTNRKTAVVRTITAVGRKTTAAVRRITAVGRRLTAAVHIVLGINTITIVIRKSLPQISM